MKFYKDINYGVHALSDEDIKNGGMSLMPEGVVEISEAEAIELTTPPPLTGNSLILSQIATLEATVTPRRQREAILGTDIGWLASLNSQIATLRANLK